MASLWCRIVGRAGRAVGPLLGLSGQVVSGAATRAERADARWDGVWRRLRHACRLYACIQQRKGHPQAVGAVARHLAEASYWILTKWEPYREPGARPASSTAGPAWDTP